MAAGAHISADCRHASGVTFQYDQRQCLADGAEHHQPNFWQKFCELLEAQELHVVFQAQAFHQFAAFDNVSRAFFFGTRNPSLDIWPAAGNDSGGTDESLDVLDRHHPANQAHDGRNGLRAQSTQRTETHHVNAVGDIAGAFGLCAVDYLAQAVGLVQRDDLVAGVVAHAAQCLKEANPQRAKVASLGRVALQYRAVVGDPAGGIQIDAPLLGVDAMLAQNQALAVPALQQRAEKSRIAG